MRVAFIGNLGNLGALFCFFLRKQGIDAHLYIHESIPVHPIAYAAEGNEQEAFAWVHRYPRNNLFSYCKSQFRLSAELLKFDVVNSITCALPPWTEFLLKVNKIPYIAYATGSDLREEAIKKTFNGHRCKKHFNDAALVIHTLDNLSIKAAEEIGLTKCRLFKIPVGASPVKQYNLSEEHEVIYFMPSRLHIQKDHSYENCIKNNQLFIHAFAKYIKAGGKAKLVLLRRGTHIQKVKDIISDLGIQKNVIWKKEMTPSELLNFFYECDVVVDQFNSLSSPLPGGGITIEALSTGTPVLKKIDLEYNKFMYGTAAPILACSTEEQIIEILVKCENKSFIKNVGEASRHWIYQYHDWKTITSEQISEYKQLVHKP